MSSDGATLLLTSVAFVRHSTGQIAEARLKLASAREMLARGRESLRFSADCLWRARSTLHA